MPDSGDIVWLRFDPQARYEQAGHRPALVLSPAIYNDPTSLMLCCPITTHVKGYPFEVMIEGDGKAVVLADQVKSLDWRVRQAKYKGKVTQEVLSEVRRKAVVLIGNLSIARAQ